MKQTQNILVTGANGYLGAQIAKHLALEGHKVTALCYPEIPSDAAWCRLMEEVVAASIAERQTIEQLQDKRFDTIVHLVSLDHHQSQVVCPQTAVSVNVQPCWELLEAFKNRGLRRFIYFSTVHVYGALSNVRITEKQSLNPLNVYALTHVLSEQICDYYHRTTDVACLTVRLSNSYGPPVFPENNCWWLAVNDLCRTAYFMKEIRLISDGSPKRDFVHGSDVCRAVEVLCTKAIEDRSIRTFHMASSKTHTLLELAGMIKEVYFEITGTNIPVRLSSGEEVVDFNRFSQDVHYQIDCSSLQNLGYEPLFGMRMGIRSLFDYFEEQRNA